MPLKRPLRPIDPDRRRAIPKSFAWIDHRLRSSGLLARMRPEDIGLYLFLVLAADRDGLSCWRLDRVERELPFDHRRLWAARKRLIELKLIAYRPWHPNARDGVYQVLSVPAPAGRRPQSLADGLENIGRSVD